MLLYSYLIIFVVGYVTSASFRGEALFEIEIKENEQVDMPFVATFPKGFEQDWQLQISGKTNNPPSRFYINLQDGNDLWPHVSSIPFHLSLRFDESGDGRGIFVRNTWMNKSWGKEERCPGFKFTPGKKFNLAIIKNNKHFAVWVNDTLAVEFPFRTPVDKINSVVIGGDVQIYRIFMRNHIDHKYFSKNREKTYQDPTIDEFFDVFSTCQYKP